MDIHQEENSMENKEQEKKAPATEELSPEQMSNAVGAGFFARVGCFFRGHHGMRVTIQRKAYKGDLYEKLQCLALPAAAVLRAFTQVPGLQRPNVFHGKASHRSSDFRKYCSTGLPGSQQRTRGRLLDMLPSRETVNKETVQ